MCPACPHRHGAYANAAPATAAGIRPAPNCRTSAYGPTNASVCSRMNMMLYRTRAAVGPVPINDAGRYPSVSENAKLSWSGKNVLASHSCPGLVTTACPAQAICHAWSSGSPRSAGIVVLGCSTHCTFMTIARASAPSTTSVHS